MSHFDKNYTNGEIIVHWKPELCQHSGNCARALPLVFDPRRKPWVELGQSDTDQLIAAVEGCPSGALTWSRESER